MLTNEQKQVIGQQWADILFLLEDRDHKGRYLTTWGNKTPLGIFETISRLVHEADTQNENKKS